MDASVFCGKRKKKSSGCFVACEQAPGLEEQIYRSAQSAGNEVRSAEEGEPAHIFLNAGCRPQKPRGELSLSAVKFQPISAAGSQNPNQSKQIIIWRSLASERHDSRRNS